MVLWFFPHIRVFHVNLVSPWSFIWLCSVVFLWSCCPDRFALITCLFLILQHKWGNNLLASVWNCCIVECFPNKSGIARLLVVWFLCCMQMDDKLGMPGMVSLNATNYTTWKTRMEHILYVKDLYEPILRESIPLGVVAKDGKSWTEGFLEQLDNLWTLVCFNIFLMNTMSSNFGKS